MGPGPVTAVALVAAYLLGSIPFSYLVARRKGIDVRTVGSGNVGATNVMRSAGRAAGLTAFALDFLKGSLATWLALRMAGPTVAAVAAVVAVVGHMYPVWLSFKGGKGVATGAGAEAPMRLTRPSGPSDDRSIAAVAPAKAGSLTGTASSSVAAVSAGGRMACAAATAYDTIARL